MTSQDQPVWSAKRNDQVEDRDATPSEGNVMIRKTGIAASLSLSLLLPAGVAWSQSATAEAAAALVEPTDAMPLAVKLYEKDALPETVLASRHDLPEPAQAAEPVRRKPIVRVAQTEPRPPVREPRSRLQPIRHFVQWTPRAAEPVLILGIGF
jgi:hypothetical protein